MFFRRVSTFCGIWLATESTWVPAWTSTWARLSFGARRRRAITARAVEPRHRTAQIAKDAPPFSAQEFLMQLAEGKTDLEALPAADGKRRAKTAEKAETAAD